MSKNINVMYSSNTDDWKTPKSIYDYFIKKLECIDCFPFHSNYDELNKVYFFRKLFVNPPFSKMNEVTDWIIKQYKFGCLIYLLIPSRTDTKYFHSLLSLNPRIYFIRGRLHYNDSKCAPFPSLLMVFYHDFNEKTPYWSTLDQKEISYE